MPTEPQEIVRCPAERRAEALAHVLCDLSASARRQISGGLLDLEDPAEIVNEPLYIAKRGGSLRGAAWAQRLSGNIAQFWPPQFDAGYDQQAAFRLADSVMQDLDQTSVEMTQAFLSSPDVETIAALQNAQFRHLADLLYMACPSERFPLAAPDPCELNYVPYHGGQRSRLIHLIEKTYEGTLDCTALNGARDVDHIINGYQATGVYRPENWLFVRSDHDVGVLLLADHPNARHWELMYMGLVPEARGRGWGRQITRYAQWLARGANVERIVVAVDVANAPAVAMYQSAGFEMWDKRAVYVRFPKRN
jgi:GNAT superfamily N-acetyltransferase